MAPIKVSDYVARFLVEQGISDVFLVSGGGIMHLLDSVGRQPGLRYVCNYHEQACAISAEAYARVKGLGACLITVGPGAVNALSGVAGAWYDSIPVIVISGQVRRDLIADYSKVRQIGPQEGNVMDLVRPVTKYAVTVTEPSAIRRELERARRIALAGRPGPVWIELPLDVQGAMVEESQLAAEDVPAEDADVARAQIERDAAQVLDALRTARRPLLLCGNGIHLARAESQLEQLLAALPVPVVVPDIAKDVVAEDQPRYVGVFGPAGQRRANFALQNSDCLVSLASGLCVKKTGFDLKGFAPKAKKVVVDIDEGQLHHQKLKPDLAIRADVRALIEAMLRQLAVRGVEPRPKWLDACRHWKEAYPTIVPEYLQDPAHVNSYVFCDALSDLLGERDVIVTGNGLDCVSYWQAFKIKRGQRGMVNGNWGAMGWDLPAAVGACVAARARTICITGDGSIQLNVHELMTIGKHRLPVKIFLFNNQGHSSIRATQTNLFGGHFVGSDFGSGLGNPDFGLLAAAYGLAYSRIDTHAGLRERLVAALDGTGPTLCEVNVAQSQFITPKAMAVRKPDGTLESKPLHDMFPFLPPEEIHRNMHLFDDEDVP